MTSYYFTYILTQTNNIWLLGLTIFLSFCGTYVLLKLIKYLFNQETTDTVELDASEIFFNDSEECKFKPQP